MKYQETFTADIKQIQPISESILGLQIIHCDTCKKELAAYDVYSSSNIEGILFLKRSCQNCLPKQI